MPFYLLSKATSGSTHVSRAFACYVDDVKIVNLEIIFPACTSPLQLLKFFRPNPFQNYSKPEILRAFKGNKLFRHLNSVTTPIVLQPVSSPADVLTWVQADVSFLSSGLGHFFLMCEIYVEWRQQ